MKETWITIKDWPYEVSSEGRVRRLGSAAPLKPRVHTNGYLRVCLCDGGVQQDSYIHRLVCSAFHGAPPNTKSHADHANKIRSDNRAANLSWLSPEDNRATRVFHFGERHFASRLSEADVMAILWRTASGETDRSVSLDFPVGRRHITDIRHRKYRMRFTNHD